MMVGIAGLIMLALIFKGYYDGKRLDELTAPKLAAVGELRLEAAAARHAVAHLLSGESTAAEPNAWQYLEQAVWYLQSLVEADIRQLRNWTPSPESGIGEPILRLNRHLAGMKSFLQQHGSQAVDPQALDDVLMQNERLFAAFRGGLDEIEADIEQSISRDRMLYRISHVVLFLFGGAMTFFMAFTIRRYERLRSEDIEALQAANRELESQIVRRKKAETALRSSEERFRGLFESAADFIHILDPQERILQSNPAAIRRLGYSIEELRHRLLSDFATAGARHNLGSIVDQIRRAGHFNEECSLVARDGSTIRVDCSAFPVQDAQGAVEFIIMFQKDISDRKLAEEKLQKSNVFLKITNRHRDMQLMLDEFIMVVRSQTGCSGSAVRLLDDNGVIPYVASNGLDPKLCRLENSILLNSDDSLCAKVVRWDNDRQASSFTPYGSFYLNDSGRDKDNGTETPVDCVRQTCMQFGYRSLALIPIRVERQTLGLIQIADQRSDLLTRIVVETLESAALQLGPAIQRIRAGEALKAAYSAMEDRVAERTLALSRANSDLRAEVEERRQAERRLRKNRNTLQTVIDGIQDALVLVDNDMHIRMLNRAAEHLYGPCPPGQAVGRLCYQAVGQTGICHDCQIPQAVRGGQSLTFERRVCREPERLEKISIYPVTEKEGRAAGAIVRIADVTEEKRFEQQLIKSEKMASLGILVSSIAHEINNPNTFVTFNIPILRDYLRELVQIADRYAQERPELELFHMSYPEFRRDIGKLVDNIEHGASRISNFVANLREFSQSNGERRKVWLDLRAVAEKVLSICRSQVKKRVRAFQMDIGAGQGAIYADEYSLEQILLNLIVNAVQAADKPDACVRLSAEVGGSWQEHTIIRVADNGCGMDAKTAARIFDPFFTTKSEAEGTGLGLYVCHNLVQRLGGRIEVQSRPGQGSTFTVCLPNKDRRMLKRV